MQKKVTIEELWPRRSTATLGAAANWKGAGQEVPSLPLLTSILMRLPPVGHTQAEAGHQGAQVRECTRQGREGQRIESTARS